MKGLIVAIVLIASTACALAQSESQSDAFIAARQPEVERIAELVYATHLNDRTWTRHEIRGCEVFAHHAFARFDSAPVHGVAAHLLAVYDLDHRPARSLDQPWQGGVKLVLMESRRLQDQNAGPREPALLTTVNQLLQQEHVRNSAAVARCVVALSGEVPAPSPVAPGDATAPTAPLPAVENVLTTLVGPPGLVRTESVSFDTNGVLTEATIEVHRVQP